MAAVASRYARAFADVVLDGKLDPKQVTEQLGAIVELYRSNLDLRRVWESPAIAAEQKRKLLDAIVERNAVLRPVRSFLAVLIDHGRIREVEPIARQLQAELNHRLRPSLALLWPAGGRRLRCHDLNQERQSNLHHVVHQHFHVIGAGDFKFELSPEAHRGAIMRNVLQ